jgi:hypothetical protein
MPVSQSDPDYKPTLDVALTRLNAALGTTGNGYDSYSIRVKNMSTTQTWWTGSVNNYPNITGELETRHHRGGHLHHRCGPLLVYLSLYISTAAGN